MNPYIRQQAETLNAAYGISVVGNEDKGVYVTDIHAGDSMRVANIDFGTSGAKSITLRMTPPTALTYLIIRQDNAKGKQLAKIKLEAETNASGWEERTFDLTTSPIGIHDVHFSFASTSKDNLFDWDWWQFNDWDTSLTSPETSWTDNTKPTAKEIYSILGLRQKSMGSGVNIVRDNNGKVRKVVTD